MTTEEAIKALKNRAATGHPEEKCSEFSFGASLLAVNEALDMAIAALRAQQERENPKPLTLDELREMDGEPVRCTSLINEKSEYAILHVVEMKKTWFIAVSGASAGYGDKDTYGKTWLAYRHKPKEATT